MPIRFDYRKKTRPREIKSVFGDDASFVNNIPISTITHEALTEVRGQMKNNKREKN